MENLQNLIEKLSKAHFKELDKEFVKLSCEIARKICYLMVGLKVKKVGAYRIKEFHREYDVVPYLCVVNSGGCEWFLEIDSNEWFNCEFLMVAATDAERIEFLSDVPAILRVLSQVENAKCVKYSNLVDIATKVNGLLTPLTKL